MTIVLVLPFLGMAQTQTENYIKTTSYQVAVATGQENTLTDTQKIEAINYVDGLGRPKQSIAIKAGGNSQNIITYIEYDDVGRTPRQYLPYATDIAVSNPFEFVHQDTLKSNIDTFYNTPKYEDTQNPYTHMVYEPSPLNRVLEQAAPGNSWALNNEHTIKTTYAHNTANEVRFFDVLFNGISDIDTTNPQLTVSGFYNANELYKSVIKDENWTPTSGNNHTTEEFTNKSGQILLKRTYADNQAHDTYYVYDDFGNLTFVLSPKGSDQIIVNDLLVSNYTEILNSLCYQYVYDYRNRLIQKKIPAKGWEYIFYDALDRPVLTQDARLRENNQYLFTKYDALNRVLYTGIYQATAGSNTSMQTIISAQSSFNETRTSNATTIGDASAYYSNGVFPTTGITLHTVTYYDDYVDHTGIILPTTVYGEAITTQTQGLPTVSKVRVLDHQDWITTVTGYDYKARPVYSASLNTYLDTQDTAASHLDFTGKVLESCTTHVKGSHQPVETKDYFTYDHQNRLRTHMQQVDYEPMQLIASNVYDELGQLETKKVGGTLFNAGYTDIVGISVATDQTITKTNTSNAFNAGITTKGTIEIDGGFTFTIGNPGSEIKIGLNDHNTSASGYDINYYFDFYDNAGIPSFKVYARLPSGSSGVPLYTGTYDDFSNRFAIEKEGAYIHYIHNGAVIATHLLVDSSIALIGDAGIKTPQATLRNVYLYATNIQKPLQEVDYQYNVRGWLTDINDVNNQAKTDQLFNFHINYDTVDGFTGTTNVTPLYNGNIAQTTWKTTNTDTDIRSYGYTYDALNRITNGISKKGTGFTISDSYTLQGVSYDKNGNITTLQRQGPSGLSSSALMDDLSYTYTGNQLQNVTDVSGNTSGFNDGSTAIQEYQYDVNGNMTLDDNKGITDITYNHLNLPTKVTINNVLNTQEGTITYIYDATGIKLAKVLVDDTQNNTVITSYAGGYIYEETQGYESLQMLPHPEGYISPVYSDRPREENTGATLPLFSTGYQYAYNYTDHLGNIRLTYADSDGDGEVQASTEIISEKHYYPFGLQQRGYNDVVTSNKNDVAERFMFNGIEKEQALGLNLYEMDVRQYDPAIARWTGIDPVTHYDYSPYNAFDNDPVFWADPSGADGDYYNTDGEHLGNDGIDDDKVYVVDESNAYVVPTNDDTYAAFGSGVTELDMTHTDFEIVAATLYAEMGYRNPNADEAAGIYDVLENRSTNSTSGEGMSIVELIQDGGIYGYQPNDSDSDYSKALAEEGKGYSSSKHKKAKEGLIKGATSSQDYSGGAYFWEGTAFLENPQKYKSNFFNKVGHGTTKGSKTKNITFEYTATVGATTFMKYNSKLHPKKTWK